MSRVVAPYRKFSADLKGWADVPLAQFRERILPLRQKETWTAEDAALARTLAEAGAGYALQELVGGRGAAALQEATGVPRFTEEPFAKAELDGLLRGFLSSAKADGWVDVDFMAYLSYLNGGQSLRELREEDSAARKIAPGEDKFRERYSAGSARLKAHVARVIREAAAACAEKDTANLLRGATAETRARPRG